MMSSFLESWPLFADSYLTGALIAVLLAMVGVVVVARDQIFIGAAVAQASTLGIAMTLAASVWVEFLESPVLAALSAVAFAVLASVFASGRRGAGRESREAIAGWIFLGSASIGTLVVARSPHGLEEIHHLLFSSMIGATRQDVWLFTVMFLLNATVLLRLHRPILMLVMDPETAAALGMPVRRWNLAMAVCLGVILGLSLRTTGMLYTFGCLVLPALITRHLCREVRPMFIAAPLLALLAAATGFILANHFDFPPGQMTIALLSAALPFAWVARKA